MLFVGGHVRIFDYCKVRQVYFLIRLTSGDVMHVTATFMPRPFYPRERSCGVRCVVVSAGVDNDSS